MDVHWNYKQRDLVGKFLLLYPVVNIVRVTWDKFRKQINVLLDWRNVYEYFQADKSLYTHC